MSGTPTTGALKEARDVAEKARQISHEHQRAHQDTDIAEPAVAKRGADLKRAAAEASSKLVALERDVRAAAGSKRRAEHLADNAGLQGRLRAEAQARREKAAASGPPPPRRGHR